MSKSGMLDPILYPLLLLGSAEASTENAVFIRLNMVFIYYVTYNTCSNTEGTFRFIVVVQCFLKTALLAHLEEHTEICNMQAV